MELCVDICVPSTSVTEGATTTTTKAPTTTTKAPTITDGAAYSVECRQCIAVKYEAGNPFCTVNWDQFCSSYSTMEGCVSLCDVASTEAPAPSDDSISTECRQCVYEVEYPDEFCLDQWDELCQLNAEEYCPDVCIIDGDSGAATGKPVKDDPGAMVDPLCRSCIADKIDNHPYCTKNWDDQCTQGMTKFLCKDTCATSVGLVTLAPVSTTQAPVVEVSECDSCLDEMFAWCLENFLGENCVIAHKACFAECSADSASASASSGSTEDGDSETVDMPPGCRSCISVNIDSFCISSWDDLCWQQSFYPQCVDICHPSTAAECTSCESDLYSFCSALQIECAPILPHACAYQCAVSV